MDLLDLNVRGKINSYKKTEVNLLDFGLSKALLDMTPKV